MARPHPALFAIAADREVGNSIDPTGLVSSAIEHRMGGLLATRVAAGDIDLDPDSRRRLEEVDLAAWARNRMLAEAASDVVSVADGMGLRVAVMKGLPSESRWYDRVGERPSYDVDIAVHPEDLHRIPELIQILHPGHSLLPDLGLLIRRGRLQSVDLAVNTLPIDLHWDPLKLDLIKTRSTRVLWERTELVNLPNGALVLAFDTEVALICHLLHMNKDRFRYLLGFADVARILKRGCPDWEFLRHFLDVEGLRTPVAESLSTVCDRLQLPAQTPFGATTGMRGRIWRLAWPAAQQMMGDAGLMRFRHRQFLIPLTGKGRVWETLRGYLGRLVPPRQLVTYYYPHTQGPYWWKLFSSRLLRRVRRRRLRASLKDDQFQGIP